MSEIKVKWVNDLKIKGTDKQKTIMFDSRYKGKKELDGSSPTNVFLMSIIGCSTMSAVALLNSKKIKFNAVETTIEPDTESTANNPYHFTRFNITYFFEGVEQEESLIEAIKTSHLKYCPMVFMVEKIAPVQYEIMNNGISINKSENWENSIVPTCNSEICETYYSY